jgi:hypothetical protein
MIAAVPREDMAVATGSKLFRSFVFQATKTLSRQVTYLFRTTGQVLGVSLSGAILQAVLLQKLRQRIQGPGSGAVRPHKFHCNAGP